MRIERLEMLVSAPTYVQFSLLKYYHLSFWVVVLYDCTIFLLSFLFKALKLHTLVPFALLATRKWQTSKERESSKREKLIERKEHNDYNLSSLVQVLILEKSQSHPEMTGCESKHLSGSLRISNQVKQFSPAFIT